MTLLYYVVTNANDLHYIARASICSIAYRVLHRLAPVHAANQRKIKMSSFTKQLVRQYSFSPLAS